MNATTNLYARAIRSLTAVFLTACFAFGLIADADGFDPEKKAYGFPNPYALDWVEDFQPGPYVSSRWGVWESSEYPTVAPLWSNGLSYETMMFYTNWNKNPSESILIRDMKNPVYLRLGSISYRGSQMQSQKQIYLDYNPGEPVKGYNLFRQLNFWKLQNGTNYPLRALNKTTYTTGSLIDAEKIVILVHGWNPGSENDPYGASNEWKSLTSALRDLQDSSDWKFFCYYWEDDADTGGRILGDREFYREGFVNGIEAAENALQHGVHLGSEIFKNHPNLQRVHFVCHSAGTWVARAAAGYLRNKDRPAKSAGISTPLTVQVTLLDPFIPGVENDQYIDDSNLEKSEIDKLSDFAADNNDIFRIFRLENFHISGDITDREHNATSQNFSWPFSNSINLDVNQFFDIQKIYLYGHSMPIQFFANSVRNSSGVAGWKDSMFMREPFIARVTQSHSGPVGVGQRVEFTVEATTRRADALGETPSISYQWFKSGSPIPGATSRTHVISSVQAADAGAYVCRVRSFNLDAYTKKEQGLLTIVGQTNVPRITSISPSPLQALPGSQTQEMTITGTGFSGSSTLVFTSPSGEEIPSNASRFVSRSATQIRYNIAVAGDAGPWQVRVVEGAIPSPPHTFLVGSSTQLATGTLQSLEISGAAYVNEGTTSLYSAIASYTNGATKAVNATWSRVAGTAATISAGQLTAGSVSGTSTVVIRAAYTEGGVAKEAQMTVAILDTTTQPQQQTTAAELLRNGDFEAGNDYWSLSNAVVSSGVFPYAGQRYAVLGETHNANDTLAQTVAIPSGSGTVSLSFALNITSEDQGTVANDTFTVSLRNPNTGAPLSTLFIASNRDRNPGAGRNFYQTRRFDLGAFKGQTVRLQFAATTNATLSTSFRVDQVSISRETTSTVTPTVDSLTIEGPAIVDESSETVYSAYSIQSDGRKVRVTPTWSEDSSKASIDANGKLKTFSVSGDQQVQVQAEYRSGSEWRTATKSVTIRDLDLNTTQQYTLNVIPAANGSVKVSPPQSFFSEGTRVTLTAVPDSGYEFMEWSRDLGGVGITSYLKMNGNKVVEAHFRPLPVGTGSVRVEILPQAAAEMGARWRLEGSSAWQASGTTLSALPLGPAQIEFSYLDGWITPPARSITVLEGRGLGLIGEYGANSSAPFVESISPSSGPVEGGTQVVITGGGLDRISSVRFGSAPAARIDVINPSRVLAVTPPGPGYGTVSVTVEAGGQVFERRNGFTYATAQGENMELLGQVGGGVGAIDVKGDYAYLSLGPSLVVVDVRNKAALAEVGRIPMASNIRDLALHGSHVFAVPYEGGIQAVDVADVRSPRLVAAIPTTGEALSVTSVGGYVLIGDSAEGLIVIDAQNPASPRIVHRVPLPGRPNDLEIVQQGGRTLCLVAAESAGLMILDVTNPAAATILGNSSVGADAYGVTSDGTYAYVGCFWSNGGLHVVRISNPAAPVHIANFPPNFMTDVARSGSTVWGVDSQLCSVNVTNPANPVRESVLDLSGNTSGKRCRYESGFLYVASGMGGLEVFDTSNPLLPVLRGRFRAPFGWAQQVRVSGDHAYVAADFEGLQVVDVRDSIRPVVVGQAASDGQAETVEVSGNHAFVTNAGGNVDLFSVTVPSAPSKLVTHKGFWALGTLVSSNRFYLYGSDYNQNGSPSIPMIGIYDLANPVSFSRVGGLALSTSYIWRGSYSNSKIFGAHSTTGQFSFIDVATDSSPSVVHTGIHGTTVTRDIVTHGNFAYLALDMGGVKVLDISNLSNPTEVRTFADETLQAFSLHVDAETLYVAAWGMGMGVHAYDLGDPSDPKLEAFYRTPSLPRHIDTAGDKVYVADSNAGLLILRHHDVRPPTLTITSPATGGAITSLEPTISLAGSASDNRGVSKVYWTSDRGRSGVAIGTETWQIPGIELEDGVNEIIVTAIDAAGNVATGTLEVAFEERRPTLTSPSEVSLSVGTETSFALTASQNPTRFFAEGLPEGLVLDEETGVISGVPLDDGSMEIVVFLTNDQGTKASRFTLTVEHPNTMVGNPIMRGDWRPDLLVGTSLKRMRGNNVYNRTGARQTATQTVRRKSSLHFFFRIENDGRTDDVIRAQSGKGSALARARYFEIATRQANVTAAVVSGRFRRSIPGLGSASYKVMLNRSKSSRKPKLKSMLKTRAISGGKPSLNDTSLIRGTFLRK